MTEGEKISNERLAEMKPTESLPTFLLWVAESYEAMAKASEFPDEIEGLLGSAQMARAHLAALEPAEDEAAKKFPKLTTVRAHKPTCANVQPGSSYEDKCDCGALDTAGNAIEITRPASLEITDEGSDAK